MLNLHLQRQFGTDEGTPGLLTGMDVEFHTLELPWRDANADGFGDPQKSRINAGAYLCEWHASPKFGMCYILRNVPGRSNVLIHAGNFAGDVDKGYRSDVLGCILLGQAMGRLSTAAGKSQTAILQSRMAIKEFSAVMAGQPFMLTIDNAP